MRILQFMISILLLTTGCSGPLGFLPGGSLGERDQPITSLTLQPHWQAEGVVIALETRPRDPYSVKVGAVVVDGSLYIDPAPERTWYQYLADNADIRFRIDGERTIYRARVFPATEAHIRNRFEAGRVPLRLGPRP